MLDYIAVNIINFFSDLWYIVLGSSMLFLGFCMYWVLGGMKR